MLNKNDIRDVVVYKMKQIADEFGMFHDIVQFNPDVDRFYVTSPWINRRSSSLKGRGIFLSIRRDDFTVFRNAYMVPRYKDDPPYISIQDASTNPINMFDYYEIRNTLKYVLDRVAFLERELEAQDIQSTHHVLAGLLGQGSDQ